MVFNLFKVRIGDFCRGVLRLGGRSRRRGRQAAAAAASCIACVTAATAAATAAAAALATEYGVDKPYFFNRKEAKDHGEGGFMVGYQPQAGDVIAIVEDVVTAGTAVRESIALFEKVAPVKISSLFVSVDRMERGSGSCSTLDELRQEYGIDVHPIVTVRDIIDFLHERPIDGKVYIDDAMMERMEAYLRQYGAKA